MGRGRESAMPFAEYTNIVLEFVRAHPNWAAFIVFGLAFGESLAFVSLILPFWAMLVGIGTIVGASDTLSFWLIVSSAAAGAALGDWLSYWLGYHYHELIEGMWPLRDHKTMVDRGKHFFKRWGAWAIILGRFSGPLRATVPIAAGIAQMPQLLFQLSNWSSAFLWAFVLLSPGTFGMKWFLEWWNGLS
ncbi:MAG TPA: DedA family protein [Hyphomicrobiaceae bacterium]|nr:DedA family protein [Hyphomicrobiaceae bacterium]